jgi:Na+/phosphate symporter
MLTELINLITENMKSGEFNSQDTVAEIQENYLDLIEKIRKQQIKRVKNGQVGTRNTILFLNIINEMKNLILHTINLYKSQRDFVSYRQKNHK